MGGVRRRARRRRRARLRDAEPADGRRLPRLRAVGARRARRARHRRDRQRRGCTRSSPSLPMVLAQGLEWIAGYEVALGAHRHRARRRSRSRCWSAAAAPPGAPRPPRSGSPISRSSGRSRCTASTPSPCRSRSPAACGWSAGRWIASVLLAVATWIKVWPAALLAAAFIAVRRRGAIIGGALSSSAPSTLWRGHRAGRRRRTRSASSPDQTDRGLQLEAPGQHVLPVARGREDRRVVRLLRPRPADVPGRRAPRSTPSSPLMTPLLVVVVAGDRRARRRQGVARRELRRAVPAARAEPRARAHRRQQGGLAAVPHLADRARSCSAS